MNKRFQITTRGKLFTQFLRAVPYLLSGKKIGIISSTTKGSLDMIHQWEKFAKDCSYKNLFKEANIYYKNWEIEDVEKQWIRYQNNE